MTTEQAIMNIGSSWIREIGPYTFTMIAILYLYLNDKGYLPKFLSLKSKLANNHVPHLEAEVSKLKVDMEKRVGFEWAEEKFKELKKDMAHDIEKLETNIERRIDSVNKRIDHINRS